MAERNAEGRLHHLAVGSADVERLARFYREFFGLSERARHLDERGWLRSVWLDLEGSLLMIELTDKPPQAVEGIGAGLFLLAFRIPPSERLALETKLEAGGHLIESRTAFTSYTRDVDGNRIAISHHPLSPVELDDSHPEKP
jgi:catechol 2,3-dioxygenase-like lactoylglutathione lyase family enzyme